MKHVESLQTDTEYDVDVMESPATLNELVRENTAPGSDLLLDEKGRGELRSAIDELYRNPGERIINEFEALNEMYRARSIRDTDQKGTGTVEYTMFGTRIDDGGQLEEVFTKIDERSTGNKDYLRTTYVIDLLDDGEQVARITVDADGEIFVHSSDHRDENDVMLDFSYRTVIAEARHARRTPAEQAAANDEALRLLNMRVFGTETPVVAAVE